MKSEREIIKYMYDNVCTATTIAEFIGLDTSEMTDMEKSNKMLKKRIYYLLRQLGYKDAACVVRNGWNGKRIIRMIIKWSLWCNEETYNTWRDEETRP